MEYFWNTDEFGLFINNLSLYYIFFDISSFLTFIATYCYCRSLRKRTLVEPLSEESFDLKYENLKPTVSNIKVKRQKVLLGQVSSNLSRSELEEEKMMERLQLEKIFELLRRQEDKFNVKSMKEVQDQLAMYR